MLYGHVIFGLTNADTFTGGRIFWLPKKWGWRASISKSIRSLNRNLRLLAILEVFMAAAPYKQCALLGSS